MTRALTPFALAALLAGPAAAQDYPLAPGAKVTKLADGFKFT